MKLEIMLNEISQTAKDKYCMFFLTCEAGGKEEGNECKR
jgi:hypothetical protein